MANHDEGFRDVGGASLDAGPVAPQGRSFASQNGAGRGQVVGLFEAGIPEEQIERTPGGSSGGVKGPARILNRHTDPQKGSRDRERQQQHADCVDFITTHLWLFLRVDFRLFYKWCKCNKKKLFICILNLCLPLFSGIMWLCSWKNKSLELFEATCHVIRHRDDRNRFIYIVARDGSHIFIFVSWSVFFFFF